MPILKMVQVTAGPTGVRLAATDLELGLQRTFPIPVLESRTFLIPCDPIHDFVRELASETITWTIDDEDHITITGGKAKAKFNGMTGTEYPTLPAIPEPFVFSVPPADLTHILKETLPAVGDADQSRYILNAVKLSLMPGSTPMLRGVGTDGHRLVVSQRSTGTWLSPVQEPHDLLIPKKAGKLLLQLIDDKDMPPIACGMNEALAGFKVGDYLVTSRLLDGKYPNHEAVMPPLTTARFTIPKAVFEDSLRRVSVINGKDTKPVELTVAHHYITLHAMNVDLGEATEIIETPSAEEDFKAGFNTRYLLDALETMPGEHCQFHMDSPLAPCVLTAPELTTQFKHIVMPISLDPKKAA